jgi:excinuclease UvrABC ATPase subunit
MTEIYDYLRLLFARVGKTFSPISGRPVKKDDVSDVVSAITTLPKGDKVLLLTVFKQHKNRDAKEELNILLQKGFSRLYAGGETLRIEDLLEMEDKALKKQLPAAATYIMIDRLVAKDFDEDDRHRISDSVTTAFYEGEGEMRWKSMEKTTLSSPTASSSTALPLKSPFPTSSPSIIPMAPAQPAKASARCWASTPTSSSPTNGSASMKAPSPRGKEKNWSGGVISSSKPPKNSTSPFTSPSSI